MTQPIIVAENLTKKYARSQHKHKRYALRDLFAEIRGRRPEDAELRPDEFYAVDDLSFSVAPGEAVALIGRNGCGKSTTLRMVAGLIKPDRGRVAVRGRIQALIALGAGFNDRLTGRDNIFNNAAVLGLGRRQTDAIVGEVIDFAELDEFLDSPVGTYSSGMKARLGFSVAVHLKPDILVVDEVLSVGDLAFANKCQLKMQQMRQRGMTLLLVSHATAMIRRICDRAIWLDRGKPRMAGNTEAVVDAYVEHMSDEKPKRKGPVHSRFEVQNHETSQVDRIDAWIAGEPGQGVVNPLGSFSIQFAFDLLKPVQNLMIGFVIYTGDGGRVCMQTTRGDDRLKGAICGRVSATFDCVNLPMPPGHYHVIMIVANGGANLFRDKVGELRVRGEPDKGLGYLQMPGAWRFELVEDHKPAAEAQRV